MTDKEIYEQQMLSEMNVPLVSWFGGILLAYIIVFDILPRSYPNWLFTTNESLFAKRALIYEVAALILVLMVVLGVRLRTKSNLCAFIVFSIIILALAVFMSGGFLDSPFSGVLPLYVGSFIILQEDKEFQTLNRTLVVLTVFLVIVPYVPLKLLTGSTSVLLWKDDGTVTFLRLFISLILLVGTGYVGHRVFSKITDLRKARVTPSLPNSQSSNQPTS